MMLKTRVMAISLPFLCILVMLIGVVCCQTPCMQKQCEEDEYCKETVARQAECVSCDLSCDGCSGEGPSLCTACQVGYRLQVAGCQECPDGFYGVNCASECNCLNNKECDNKDGKCNDWKCKRGYTGIPLCREKCPLDTFGLDCALICHCPEGDVCNHVNGDCPSGQCAPNYGGAGCQRHFPRLATAPEILSAQCNNITLQWSAFNEEDNIGEGPIFEYRVEVHLNQTEGGSPGPWQSVGIVRHVDSKRTYTISALSNVLEPDKDYNFRINTIGDNFEKPMAVFTPGLVSETVNNPCAPITTPEPTQPPVSREVFQKVEARSINDTTMRLTWTVLAAYARFEYNVNITLRLLGNGDCDEIGAEEENFGPYSITDSPQVFAVQTWSKYSFMIIAQALTVDVREVRLLTEISNPVAPTATVSDLNVTGITASGAIVTWTSMPCDQRKGFSGSYDLDLRLAGGNPVHSILTDVTMNRYDFHGLPAYTEFNVRIRYRNEIGTGPYVSQDFKTLEGVPTAVQIASTTATSTTITVTFDPPLKTNGVLVSYTVALSKTSDFNETESRTEQARTGLRSIIVGRLQPNTLFYLRMAASTNAGIGKYGLVTSQRTLEAPPPAEDIALRLDSQTIDCLLLRWDPPQNRADDIHSYKLEVRMATADQTIPSISVDLPGTSSSYRQCDLKPSSLYIVTIMALDSGQEVITSITSTFSTAHGTPPQPRAPTFVRSSYTNVTVTIEPVVSQYVPITSYRLHVLMLTSQNRNQFVFPSVPGYITAELEPAMVPNTVDFVIGDGEVIGGFTNQPLMRNSEYRIYYVAVSTLNNETTSSSSSLTLPFPTVPFDPALAPPLPLSLSARTPQCLNLTWTTPPGLDALITSFDFSISQAGNLTGIPITRLVSDTDRNLQQCNLAPFTLYTVRISARIGQEVSASATETFLTLHTAPPVPLRPVFADSTYTTLTVYLEPSVLTSGPVSAYQLHVEEVSAPSGAINRKRKRSAAHGTWSAIDSGMLYSLIHGNAISQGNSPFVNKLGRSRRAASVPGYITAELEKGDITPNTEFVVGDGKTYGGYLNVPLSRERWYVVHYVVLSTSSNVTKMSFSSLIPQAQTIPYVSPTEPTEDNDDNTGVLIGVIVGLVLLLLVLLLLLLLYLWWRRRNRFNPYELHNGDIKLPPEPADDYDPMKYWSDAQTVKEGRYIMAGRELVFGQDMPRPQAAKNQIGSPETPTITFKDEFHALPHKSNKATDNIARRQGSNLNRFPHLLPYDHSLVQLRPDATSRGSYINASFIPGYKRTPAYIAAQSPYNKETVLDFWRLIYQRSIKTVVMITNIVEDHIVKCTQYWPTQSKASFGDVFFLHLVEIAEYADYTIRTIGVKMKGDTDSKVVRLFEFTSWPDHGVPDDPIPFLEMRYKVSRYHHDELTPILVHCGTGMARTGVFIAVDALIDQYASESRAMVYDFVRRMRKDRPFMVRTFKQYRFIYEAIFEEFHAGDTLVDFDLKGRYHDWTQKNPQTGRTYLRDQFKLLETFTREPRRDQCKAAQLESNVHKNRFLDVLPADKDRPFLKTAGQSSQATDYINAIYVDGYLRRNQFIVTQTPLHTTVLDFWRLVWDHDVRTIVMVENFKHEDDTRAEYWPPAASGGVMKQLEPFFVETTACYQQENITVRNLRLLSTQHPRDPARFVRQFQFKAWAEHAMAPQSKTMMLDLVDSVFDWQEETCRNERPVLVHCLDGSSHSGLFISLAAVCERMEEDAEVDVYRTIKHMKRHRGQFISDYEQFRFCYKALWDFMSLRMPGGTFTDTLGQSKTDKEYGVASLNLSSHLDNLNDLGDTNV